MSNIVQTWENFYEKFKDYVNKIEQTDLQKIKDEYDKFKKKLDNNPKVQKIITTMVDNDQHLQKLFNGENDTVSVLKLNKYKDKLNLFMIQVLQKIIVSLSPDILIITDKKIMSLLEQHLDRLLSDLFKRINESKYNDKLNDLKTKINDIFPRRKVIRSEFVAGGSKKKYCSLHQFKRNNLNKYLHNIGVDYKKFKNKKLISNFLRTLIIYRGGKFNNKSSLKYLAKYLISYNKNDTVKSIKNKINNL